MFGTWFCLGAGSYYKLHYLAPLDLQVLVHVFVDFHDRGLVSAAVAIVWRTKNSDDRALVRPIVAFHYELVSASHSRQVICMLELIADVSAETVPGTPGRNAPPLPIVWVAPQQVTDGSLVRHFLNAVQLSNIVKGVDARRQPPMQTENLPFDTS